MGSKRNNTFSYFHKIFIHNSFSNMIFLSNGILVSLNDVHRDNIKPTICYIKWICKYVVLCKRSSYKMHLFEICSTKWHPSLIHKTVNLKFVIFYIKCCTFNVQKCIFVYIVQYNFVVLSGLRPFFTF